MRLTGKRFYFRLPESKSHNEVFQDMNAILQEEMGIARQVIDASAIVRNSTFNDAKGKPSRYEPDIGLNIKSGSTQVSIFAITNVAITYNILFFKEMEQFEETAASVVKKEIGEQQQKQDKDKDSEAERKDSQQENGLPPQCEQPTDKREPSYLYGRLECEGDAQEP